jgi:hypothetical protein
MFPDQLLGQEMSATTPPRFAFVLFRSAPTVDVVAVARAHAELNAPAPALIGLIEKSGDETNAVGFKFADSKGEILVGMMPFAVPDGEAQAAAELSVSRFAATAAARLNEHGAHAVVALTPWQGSTAVDELTRLSWAVAAVAKATGALAVYWGNGSVAHPADFFIDSARNSGTSGEPMRLPLWLGISFAAEGSGVSFLTYGVQEQFGLPDLKLWSPKGKEIEALSYAFNLVSYVIDRGVPIAAGETIGSTTEERLVVRYEPSPIGKPAPVMCVDLPGKRGWWPFRR